MTGMRVRSLVVWVSAAVGLTLAVAASAGAVARAGPTRVRVTILAFHYRLSRQSVPVGPTVFTVVNRTAYALDFRIDGVGATPILKPGARYVLRVRFRGRGRYVYYGMGQYSEMGLIGDLVVR